MAKPKLKTEFQMQVIHLIKCAREANNLSQGDIADFLDVTRGYIGQIESVNSPSKYTLDQLNTLALKMKCSPKDFMPEAPIARNHFVQIKKNRKDH